MGVSDPVSHWHVAVLSYHSLLEVREQSVCWKVGMMRFLASTDFNVTFKPAAEPTHQLAVTYNCTIFFWPNTNNQSATQLPSINIIFCFCIIFPTFLCNFWKTMAFWIIFHTEEVRELTHFWVKPRNIMEFCQFQFSSNTIQYLFSIVLYVMFIFRVKHQ